MWELLKWKIEADSDLPPELEAQRIKVMKRFKRVPLLALVLALLALGWIGLKNLVLFGIFTIEFGFSGGRWAITLKNAFTVMLWVLFPIALYINLCVVMPLRKFQTAFRSTYVPQEVNHLPGFEQVQYRQQNGFSWQEVHTRGLLPSGIKSLFQSGDLFMGKCDGMSFTSMSVVTGNPPQGRSSAPDTQFEGQLIVVSCFDRRKTSQGVVQVLSRDRQRDKDCVRVSQQMQTEDQAFNDQFAVWAENAHNAFYILTPQVLERLKALHESLGRGVYLHFDGSVLYLALDLNRQPFDVMLDDPQEKRLERIRQDAQQVRIAAELAVGLLEQEEKMG